MKPKVTQIYETHIKLLPIQERLELLALVARDLAQPGSGTSEQQKHSIMELHGLGKEIWEGIDAQEYVNRLRNEWERTCDIGSGCTIGSHATRRRYRATDLFH